MKEIESKINIAIKGLTRRVNLKKEHIFILENVLINSEIDTLTNYENNHKIWDKYLNGNNTKIALEQSIYTSEMVRLLTIRAIIIPETISEFLEWLQNRQGKNKEHYQLSYDFQISLGKNLSENTPNLNQNIVEGVRLIINELVNKPYLLEGVIWLLKSSETLWGKAYDNEVRISIENQLAFMSHFPNNCSNFSLFKDEEYQQIRQSHKIKIIPKYKILSHLFTKLDNKSIPLAMFFYQISIGKVPTKIYQKIKPNLTKIFGIEIKEKANFFEKIVNFIRNFRLSNLNFFRKEMLYCLGWIILWFTLFIIFGNINPELIIFVVIANIPLVSFYLIGLIFMGFTQLFLREINYYEYNSDDTSIMIISVIFNLLILPYLLNYIYRYQIFKNKKIWFRIKEFFCWLIPFIILIYTFNFLLNYLE